MWKFVASRYADEDTIAGFDLFNEPSTFSMGGNSLYGGDPYWNGINMFCAQVLPQFYERLVDAVRTTDNSHLIIWEPAAIYHTTTLPPNRPGVVFSPHYPTAGIYSWAYNCEVPYYNGSRACLEKVADTLSTMSQEWNQPIFVGEWGMLATDVNVREFVADLSDILDGHFIGSAWWSYGRSSFGMNLLDVTGAERTALTQPLIRPYPAVSSMPTSYSIFDTDAKELRVGVTGPSVLWIYLPASSHPLQVKVDGADVSWRRPVITQTIIRNIVIVFVPSGGSEMLVSLR